MTEGNLSRLRKVCPPKGRLEDHVVWWAWSVGLSSMWRWG